MEKQSRIEYLRYNEVTFQSASKLPLLFDFVPPFSRGGSKADSREDENGNLGIIRAEASEHVHWINIENPSPEILESLTEYYGIHPMVLDDIKSPLPRPKYEEHQSHLYVTIQVPAFKEGQAVRQGIALICGNTFLISFLSCTSPLYNSLSHKIKNDHGKIRKMGADYLMYCLLDEGIDASFPIIEILEDNVEDLESEILQSSDQDILEQILEKKREISSLRRYIWPLTETMSALQRTHSTYISPEVRVYLKDVVDHCTHLSDLVNSLRDMTLGLLELYHSSVSSTLNKVIKVLTVISTIFIPLTFISSVYGMNFKNMPELDNALGYPIVLGVMALLGLGMFYYFKRKKWI